VILLKKQVTSDREKLLDSHYEWPLFPLDKSINNRYQQLKVGTYLLIMTVAPPTTSRIKYLRHLLSMNGVITMTIKTPYTSAPLLNTPTKKAEQVTFDEILDAKGQLVGHNDFTFDKTLKAKGTAVRDVDLWLLNSDDTIIAEVTRDSSGTWSKDFTLSEFKSYSLIAMEQERPYDFSSPRKVFVLATETPIINSVAGKDGLIGNGDTYYGDSVDITGNAPPGMEVEAFNGDTPLGQKALVNDVGLFNLTLDELKPATYSLKIKAPNEKESVVFTLIVATDNPLSLDDVIDSHGPVLEGATTYDTSVTVSGRAQPGAVVQLLNNNVPIEGATDTAKEGGTWEIILDVTPDTYSLTAKAPGEETAMPRTFSVAMDVELSLDEVLEFDGGASVPDEGTTYKDELIIKGHARPGEGIQLLDAGVEIPDATAMAGDADGAWAVQLKVTEGRYSLAARAEYGEGDITEPSRTFNVASIIKPYDTKVVDTNGLVENNGNTPYNYVVVRGNAAPLAAITLKINGDFEPESKPEPTNEEGRWAKFVSNLTRNTTYEFIAVADYGDNPESEPWTIKVLNSSGG
jgi:hypothetical protein